MVNSCVMTPGSWALQTLDAIFNISGHCCGNVTLLVCHCVKLFLIVLIFYFLPDMNWLGSILSVIKIYLDV